MAGTPVLVAHASFDAIVPASAGELLIARLGWPERLVFLGGHMGLFYMLPKRAEWIADWLDRHTPALAEPAEPPPAGPCLQSPIMHVM